MTTYYEQKQTGKRYPIVSRDAEKNIVRLKGEHAEFDEPDDDAHFARMGYVKREGDPTSDPRLDGAVVVAAPPVVPGVPTNAASDVPPAVPAAPGAPPPAPPAAPPAAPAAPASPPTPPVPSVPAAPAAPPIPPAPGGAVPPVPSAPPPIPGA